MIPVLFEVEVRSDLLDRQFGGKSAFLLGQVYTRPLHGEEYVIEVPGLGNLGFGVDTAWENISRRHIKAKIYVGVCDLEEQINLRTTDHDSPTHDEDYHHNNTEIERIFREITKAFVAAGFVRTDSDGNTLTKLVE